MAIIEVKNLCKNYGSLRAVDGIDFSIEEGEIFGMVGPNGAGKTTTTECIEGLKKNDAGEIRVFGLKPYEEREKLYQHIGVQLQETSYQSGIKVWEICDLFSCLYRNPTPYKELCEKFGLSEKRNSYVSRLSGGQRQRLSIVLALIPNPRAVFFDELTTGLDPEARRTTWASIKELRDEGRTVFLTTHFMEEAEVLCDRVAIMDQGKIVALDTPRALIETSGIEERIIFEGNMCDVAVLNGVKGVLDARKSQSEVTVYGKGSDLLQNIVDFLHTEGINYENLQIKTPTLEDVFLRLAGHNYKEDKDESTM
jgi:ABC-2 type transport system ATP-binding protein